MRLSLFHVRGHARPVVLLLSARVVSLPLSPPLLSPSDSQESGGTVVSQSVLTGRKLRNLEESLESRMSLRRTAESEKFKPLFVV